VSSSGAVRTGSRRVAVVALGSVLEGDDGAGPAALAELLAGWELPVAVEPLDLGTPGPYLAEHLRGFDAVVILDAVRSELPPGTVVVETDARRIRSAPARLSPHDPNLGEALDQLALTGDLPEEVVVVGVVPERVGLGTELSAEVEASVAILADSAAEQLRRLGSAPRRRTEPSSAERWWRRGTVHPPGLRA
jgi:hydrogenase maturation protease